MAIYHLEAKIVSRGAGRSAVAAAAYLSCSKILNDYDGIQHDYTRKKGVAAGLFCRKMDGRFCRKKPDTDVRRAGRIDVAGVFCRTREGRGQSRSLH